MSDRLGQQLGNYRLVTLLGQGGFAEVYLGQHVRLSLHAAIKVLHRHLTDQEAEHFYQEAETIAKLMHPAIIRILDYDVQDGVPFLVMDYAPNGSLRRRHPKGTVVSLPQIVSYVKQAAAALQYAHDHKYIHRDVKPENMLLGRQQEVLLSDFGLAALAHSSASLSTQEAIGTLSYMAPEQIEGHPRPASDQYALGCMIYEWLCGARPFEGSPTEVMVQQLSIPPQPLRERDPTIPLALEQVVLCALAKDPKDRFASVQDFAKALEQASQFTSSHAALLPFELHAPGPAEASSYTTVAVPTNRPATPSLDDKALQDASVSPSPDTAFHASTTSSKNRQRFLAKVRSFWIDGVLEKSLHGAALIALGLHEQSDALANPWSLVFQQPHRPAHLLPGGTRITQVYDRAGGELLILGEPGSGKTTLLLELARDLLNRARK